MSTTSTKAIGADSAIGVSRIGHDWEGRTRYAWTVTTPGGVVTGDDMFTGVGMDDGPDSMVGTLALFLGAYAEAIDYETRTGSESENADLFPDTLRDWVTEHSDELSLIAEEREEGADE